MKKFTCILLGVCLLAWTLPALAWQTRQNQNGNTYQSYPSYNGTRTQGYNWNTGSQWNTNHQRGGNMSGTDSNGNTWQYNRSTGQYYNYGTGETRSHGKRW